MDNRAILRENRKLCSSNQFVSSDEAPDTGDESDEDLITSYLSGDHASNYGSGATADMIPLINVISHSPNSTTNHNNILEENLIQLSEIHENIQRMRIEYAELSKDKTCSRLSASCPSLHESKARVSESLEKDPRVKTMNTPSSSSSASLGGSRRKGINESIGKAIRKRSGRQRSLSVSSCDSDEISHDVPDGRQRSSSSAAVARSTVSVPISVSLTNKTNTPESKIGRSKKSHLFSHLPTLQKSVSTPSIVVDKRKSGVTLAEPTHVFIQKLIADHEWAARRSVATDSDTEEDYPILHEAQRSSSGLGSIGSLTQRFLRDQQPSPQLSLVEFLRDPSLEDTEESRKRRRKKERNSIFFRKKKEKTSKLPPTSVGLPKASFAHPNVKIGSGNHRIPQHSYSMSSLRKSSSGTPSLHMSGGSLHRNDFNSKMNDERDEGSTNPDDTFGLLDHEFAPGEEFPEYGPATTRSLDTNPLLKIEEEEPENWQQTRMAEDMAGLLPMDIKRQEHIYEFIVTESNHCQVLHCIQKIFVEGMIKILNFNKDVIDRMFPCLDLLLSIHCQFLQELRIRQNQEAIVETIDDILASQFNGDNGRRWRNAYTTFCTQHSDAVSLYKELLKSNRRFQAFVNKCSSNPLLKKKGVPECILFVTTRITKYPLLIEPLIKTAKGRPEEQKRLTQALDVVKDILKEVNSKVAEKERELRLIDIYNKIDAKSSLTHGGKKFKKSDILSTPRRLMFEGSALLHQSRNRSLQVSVVLLSDILIFLQENNQKLVFVTPELRPAIVPVHSLIARENNGSSSKSLILLSNTQPEPQMYHIDILQPPMREDWIRGIREAVDASALGSDSDQGPSDEEEQRRRITAKYTRSYHLTAELRRKDLEIATLLEDKMRLLGDTLGALGTQDPFKDSLPDYSALVREKEECLTKEELLRHLLEANRLISSVYSTSSSLSRSVSSAGEQKSQTYTSPVLPKRAETFGGFDQFTSDVVEESLGVIRKSLPRDHSPSSDLSPLLINMESSAQQAAVTMSHILNSCIVLISEHFTSLESYKTELSEARERLITTGGRYKHNQQLEELRNLQDKLSSDKLAWQQEYNAQELELEEKKAKLVKEQMECERQKADVSEQREQLYRKLEALKAQGIDLASNMTILKNESPIESPSYVMNVKVHHDSVPSSPPNRKSSTSFLNTLGSAQSLSNLNLHLLSTTNETTKGCLDKHEFIKQQIPVKLSSKLSISTSSGSKDKSSFKKSASVNNNKLCALKSGEGGSLASLHQLLPFKLSESDKKTGGSPKGKHDGKSEPIQHTRTGSSPALITPSKQQQLSEQQAPPCTENEKVVFL